MRNLKILGLSLLALVGVMAVSASAAQAEWLLLLNEKSVTEETFNVTVDAGELLVPKLGVQIFCTGGEGTASIKLDASKTKLTGSTSGKFTGCKDLKFPTTCKVMGVGDPDGTIKASGEGEAAMEGEKVLLNATANPTFAKVEYLGEECPLLEVDGKVAGGVTLEVLEPLVAKALHQIHLVKQTLTFGGQAAKLHAGAPGEGVLLGSVKTLDGSPFAIHLVGKL